jgi:hypothetical protein
MTLNKPLHHPLILALMIGGLVLLMPVWLSALLVAGALLLTLTWLIHRHWHSVCYACQVASEFLGFCLLVLAFVGLSLGLSALVDVPGS